VVRLAVIDEQILRSAEHTASV